jgi:hypothetical protein
MSWKDVSSFSQNAPREQRIPNHWHIRIGELRLSLHQHIHDKGKWFVTCEPFLNMREIGKVGDDVDMLKQDALAHLSQKIDDVRGAISVLSQ